MKEDSVDQRTLLLTGLKTKVSFLVSRKKGDRTLIKTPFSWVQPYSSSNARVLSLFSDISVVLLYRSTSNQFYKVITRKLSTQHGTLCILSMMHFPLHELCYRVAF